MAQSNVRPVENPGADTPLFSSDEWLSLCQGLGLRVKDGMVWSGRDGKLYPVPVPTSRSFLAYAAVKLADYVAGLATDAADTEVSKAVAETYEPSRGADAFESYYVSRIREETIKQLIAEGLATKDTKTTDKVTYDGKECTVQSIINRNAEAYREHFDLIVQQGIEAGKVAKGKATTGGKPGRKAASLPSMSLSFG